MLNFIVIGTDHDLQKAAHIDTGLRDLLTTIKAENDVVLVAEEVLIGEDNTFGRELFGASIWLSVDMTDEQREDAGIFDTLRKGVPPDLGQDGSYHPANGYQLHAQGVREHFWLDRVFENCRNRAVREGTVVVTCGANHAHFLSAKIAARGHFVAVRYYIPYDLEKKRGVFRVFP